MFSIYRRHEETCPHAAKGVRHTRCSCPVWMDGYDSKGKRHRRSLKTRDWRHAGDILERIEAGAPLPRDSADRGMKLADAITAYLGDCKARKLAPGTLTGYENFLEHLQKAFPAARLAAMDLNALSKFRAAREVKTGTQLKEMGYLRAFFNFCLDCDWVPKNPAKALRLPKHEMVPTMPFSNEEMAAMLKACDRIDNPNQREIPRARLRAKALILGLAYTGLRISDLVKLERASVDGSGRLLLRMMKTRVPIYLPLRPESLAALNALPVESKYFFWSGTSKLATAVGSARRTVDCVVRLADIAGGHPHRFRDTFSVALLDAGEDLRTVQLLLGHTSIRTTEKHYAPFVRAMQKRLDAAVDKLHFGLPADPLLDPPQNTSGDAKGNVLPFVTRRKRSA